jgi:hypothetical protein
MKVATTHEFNSDQLAVEQVYAYKSGWVSPICHTRFGTGMQRTLENDAKAAFTNLLSNPEMLADNRRSAASSRRCMR